MSANTDHQEDVSQFEGIFKEIQTQDLVRDMRLTMTSIKNSIRNVITDLEEGDVDEAIADLKRLIGDE